MTATVTADLSVGPPGTPEVRAAGDDDYLGAEPTDGAAVLLDPPPAAVDPLVVRGLLEGMGRGLGAVAGHDQVDAHWHFTPTELDQLAGTPGAPGALTRWINRQPRLQAAVARGDEALIVFTLATYTGRNVQALRMARQEEEDHGDELAEAGRIQIDADLAG